MDHYRTYHPTTLPKLRSGAKEYKAVRARLEEGHTVADLCEAIDGCHKTPHNLGANERGSKYLGLELICRTSDQVTRFIEANRNPPRPTNDKERRTLEACASWIQRGRTD